MLVTFKMAIDFRQILRLSSGLNMKSHTLGVVRQYMATLSASLSFAMAGTAIAWPSPMLPRIIKNEAPVQLDVIQISWVVSLLYLGNLSSPVPAGYLANRFGCRKVLLYGGILSILSWLFVIFATDAQHLYVARYLAGLQLGIVSTIQPIYIGEIAQADIRGTLSSFSNLFFGIGHLCTFVVGPYVSYYTLGIVSQLIPVLFVITFIYMPESPYFWMRKSKIDKARESLSWLRGDLNRVELEIELNQIEIFVQSKLQGTGTFVELFTSKVSRKALIISTAFCTVKILTGAGVFKAYATLTLPQKTFGLLTPDACLIVLGVVGVLSSLMASCLADMYGRRFLLIISCMGCGASTLAIAIWCFLDDKTSVNTSTVSFVPFVSYLVHGVFYSVACGPIGATVKGEFFPAHVKTMSSAISSISQAINAFIINKAYLILASWEGVYVNYVFYAISCVLGALFTIFYVPETKGKTLQEIQEILTGVPHQSFATSMEKRILDLH